MGKKNLRRIYLLCHRMTTIINKDIDSGDGFKERSKESPISLITE